MTENSHPRIVSFPVAWTMRVYRISSDFLSFVVEQHKRQKISPIPSLKFNPKRNTDEQ